MKIITATNIQEKLQKAGCVIDHYCSDLHTAVKPASREIVDRYEFKQSVEMFRSEIDGVMYYDIPFVYSSNSKSL